MVKTLAEPNLTAVSGETASFLVGGKFPLPSVVGVGTSSQIVPTFYPFGIQLTFTPVVLSSGLISLRIATAVSEISTPTTISGTTVPSLTERSATTTVELPSGGSIAIAGLLQNDIQNTIQGLPGLKDMPILGALFSSKQFQHNETDLVIAVTAFLVRAGRSQLDRLPVRRVRPGERLQHVFPRPAQRDLRRRTPERAAPAEGSLRLHPGVSAMSDPPVRARIGPVLWALRGARFCSRPAPSRWTRITRQRYSARSPARDGERAGALRRHRRSLRRFGRRELRHAASRAISTAATAPSPSPRAPPRRAATAPNPARMEALRQRLVAAGVPASAIRLQLAAGRQPDTVTLSYERYTALLPTCGDWSTPMAFNPLNTDYARTSAAPASTISASCWPIQPTSPAMRRPAPADTANTERVIREYRGVGLGRGAAGRDRVEPGALQSGGDQNAASGSTVGTGATERPARASATST